MKQLEDKIKLKDISVDDLISRLLKESPSTLFHISELRKYFDPFYKKTEQPKTKRK